jgi:hypothetical protein
MGHCYHHALSSVRKWGGTAEDYLPLHNWFDVMWTSKPFFAHFASGDGRPGSHKRRPVVGRPPGKEPTGS